jgi:bacillolysin
MRSSDRTARCGNVLRLSPAFVLLAGLFSAGLASAQDDRPRPVAHPLGAVPSGQAEAGAAAPAGASGLEDRLRAARSAALSPGQPVPQPAPESAGAARPAPLAERIGRDVTYVARPGVGTPMQIRGDVLQARVERAAPGEDADLSTAREFLRANRAVLGLDSPDDELALRQRFADELGLDHLKFEQRWQGLSVWPGELIVHLDRQGHVYLMDGAYVFTPHHVLPTPVLTGLAAVRRARAELPDGQQATVSAPELVVFAPWTRGPRLAWKMLVDGPDSGERMVFVDAANGTRLASIPTEMSENVPGSGQDLHGQTKPLNTWNAGGTLYMVDTSKPMYDASSQPPHFTTTRGAIFIYDAQNQPATSTNPPLPATLPFVTSTNPNSWLPPDAVSAAFGLSKTYDYYRERHSRNSLDGNGGSIAGLVRLGQNWANAQWRSQNNIMVFGDHDKYAGSIDVVAHELTHGVTSHSADLVYQDQSGAMNESFSDIFGEMVEAYVNGSNDWLIGSQLNSPIRNMANPAQFNDPSKMSQFVTTTQDFGGVHTNSGIFNHAFYELAQGLPGAIGLRDAERIYYRALTVHLTKNAQFVDGRLACVQSAQEIFGQSSTQAQLVAQAFDAVEILGATPPPPPPNSPPVTGADSVLFLSRNGANLLPSRRETGLGDPAVGVYLNQFPNSRTAAEERLSVSGDGSLGIFVTSDHDACFFATNGTGSLSCLGLPGTISSVAMSRDTNVYAVVLLSGGQPDNHIVFADIQAGTTQTYLLLAPATDGGSSAGVLYADTLQFTANRRFLLYDAFNVLGFADGTQAGLWSISAIDLITLQTYGLIPPTLGLDVGNPAIAHTSDDYFTFEADIHASGLVDIYAAKLSTGAVNRVVVGVGSGVVVPAYTGDDSGIVYSYPDTTAPTGRSLAIEALAADKLTASGNPQTYLADGEYPIIYRRGTYNKPAANCVANSTTLCLSSGRFQVTATFTTPQGQQGVASAVGLTSDTGYFTFFNPANVEVVIKVLNACGLNQKLWVFAGGLTNVAAVITATDTLTGVSKIYTNPQSTAFVPVQDTTAFGTCFAGTAIADSLTAEDLRGDSEILKHRITSQIMELAASPLTATAEPESAPVPAAVQACVPDSHTLCLSNNRFQVRTTWRTSDGSNGSGNAVGLTADTGYFWFFSASNVEMVVKVLDACPVNGRKWVFAGGLTNVQVTTTVTDTQTGLFRQYPNALGQPFQPLQDTNAFTTCP